MLRCLLLSVLFVGQAFGHLGFKREQEALEAAHDRGEAYQLKPGFKFANPVIKARNDRFAAQAHNYFAPPRNPFGGLNDPRSFARDPSPSASPVPGGSITPSTPEYEFAGRNIFQVPRPTPISPPVFPPAPTDPLRRFSFGTDPELSSSTGGRAVRQDVQGSDSFMTVDDQLDAWNRLQVSRTFGYNAENSLRQAVRKVYADRRIAQLTIGDNDLRVDLNYVVRDPHVNLWQNCFADVRGGNQENELRNLFDTLQAAFPGDDMIVDNGYAGRGHCVSVLRLFC